MRLFFTSRRGLLTRGASTRGGSSLTSLALETLPPVFHVCLLSLLTYYSLYLNPGNFYWHFAVIFIVGQILSNWFMFWANRSIVYASTKNFPGYKHRSD